MLRINGYLEFYKQIDNHVHAQFYIVSLCKFSLGSSLICFIGIFNQLIPGICNSIYLCNVLTKFSPNILKIMKKNCATIFFIWKRKFFEGVLWGWRIHGLKSINDIWSYFKILIFFAFRERNTSGRVRHLSLHVQGNGASLSWCWLSYSKQCCGCPYIFRNMCIGACSCNLYR